MNKRLLIAVFAAVMLLAGYTVAIANHPGGNVSLMKVDPANPTGPGIPVGSTDAYSPKLTCARACHTPANGGTDEVDYAGHNYGSGEKHSIHTQAVLESDGKLRWQSYDVKGFEHGASVGRHSNQGRNEDYSNKFRSNYALPWFTSSPGMFGKF